MQPIYINTKVKGALLVLPDTQAHLDGHPVLTYSYYLYYDHGHDDLVSLNAKASELLLENKTDPDYIGEIVFELPGQVFNYIAGHGDRLTMEEVQQAVEQISHYRDHNSLWKP